MVLLILKNFRYQGVRMLTGCVTDSVVTVVLPIDILSIASYQDFLKCVNKSFDYISIVPSLFSMSLY